MKPYGSGYFGEWIEDEFGLPAYHYTCDQINDPNAITTLNEVWRSKTDHIHQVGNDRLVGVASNYGYIQVRQDEGSPKYLNVYDPEFNQFAGGFGYLTDGTNILSTFYSGSAESFDRILGIGYIRKNVSDKDLTVDQVIFAPFGDDPLLISQVTIYNNRKEAVDLRWIEYWDCQMYQFSLKLYGAALSKNTPTLARQLRREFSQQFKHRYSIIDNGSGLQAKKFLEKPQNISGNRYPTFEDMAPPITFLASLDAKPDGISTNGSQFFGKGGVELPDGLNKPISSSEIFYETESAMILERKLHLEPEENHTLYFAFGYIPEGFEIGSLLNRYKNNLSNLWEKSSESWKNNGIKLIIPDEPWVERELSWHNYYLRSGMTYDDYFKEHIISQGYVYQYIIGIQAAARDPLQHSLPFIYSQPEIVKNVLRYTLKTVNKKGEIPSGITGSGMFFAFNKPSDLQMWLLWLASEYVLATRDINFLDEEIPTYPIYGKKAKKALILDLLALCYEHFTESLGTGRHNLQRISNGDWNDTVILKNIPEDKHEEIVKNGESVLNSAMAIFSLGIYAEMLDFLGNHEMATKILHYTNTLREAVQKTWNGKWFKRAWLTEDIGWIGEDQLWLEPQPWAIIGGSADSEQIKTLIKSIDELLRKPSNIGAMILSKGFLNVDRPLGEGTNGGVWPSLNGTLIWAFSLIDGNIAWDEWKKNSLANHAENYPELWYGIWSGPDTYNSALSKYPGHTRFDIEAPSSTGFNFTDFPVMNMHPHAWPLYNTTHLLGIKFTPEGIEFSPKLPKNEYEFSSPLIGFKKSKKGYSGWYNPKREGSWKIKLKLSTDDIKNFNTLEINGKEEKLIIKEDMVLFEGMSKSNKPLYWIIK